MDRKCVKVASLTEVFTLKINFFVVNYEKIGIFTYERILNGNLFLKKIYKIELKPHFGET